MEYQEKHGLKIQSGFKKYEENSLEITAKNVSLVRNLSQGRNNFDRSRIENAIHGTHDS